MFEIETIGEVLKHYLKNDELFHTVIDAFNPIKPVVKHHPDGTKYCVCGKCGKSIDSSDFYCRMCGTKIDRKDGEHAD